MFKKLLIHITNVLSRKEICPPFSSIEECTHHHIRSINSLHFLPRQMTPRTQEINPDDFSQKKNQIHLFLRVQLTLLPPGFFLLLFPPHTQPQGPQWAITLKCYQCCHPTLQHPPTSTPETNRPRARRHPHNTFHFYPEVGNGLRWVKTL